MPRALLKAAAASDSAPQSPPEPIEIPRWGPLVRLPHGVMAWNQRGPDEIAHHLDQHLVHCMFTPYRDRETTLGGSKIRRASASPGACEIVPAGAEYWARWHQCKEVVTYAVDSHWLNRIAEEELDLTNVEIEADALPLADKRIVSLTYMLRGEFQACGEELSDIYAESLLLLLGTHLLRNHSNVASKGTRTRPIQGIPPKRLGAVTEYMRENLQRSVFLAELASIASLSPDYFVRAFKASTGITPHKYLVNLRLDRAQHLLATSLLPIADIACAAGFAQQSHLTAMMLRERKITPSAYRSAIQHKWTFDDTVLHK